MSSFCAHKHAEPSFQARVRTHKASVPSPGHLASFSSKGSGGRADPSTHPATHANAIINQNKRAAKYSGEESRHNRKKGRATSDTSDKIFFTDRQGG
ncbi:hypothetical protein BKA81DRAFT_349665 [Phyllosticta paracitricarpa]